VVEGKLMGYNVLIDKNLNLAFKLLKDQVIKGVLKKKTGTTFDFGTADVSHAASSERSVNVIVIDSEKKGKEHATKVKSVLLKKTDIEDISFYDTLVLSEGEWSIGKLIKNTGRILMFEINREGADG
jgi:hypothetical protein